MFVNSTKNTVKANKNAATEANEPGGSGQEKEAEGNVEDQRDSNESLTSTTTSNSSFSGVPVDKQTDEEEGEAKEEKVITAEPPKIPPTAAEPKPTLEDDE
jgi:hypothetical protein